MKRHHILILLLIALTGILFLHQQCDTPAGTSEADPNISREVTAIGFVAQKAGMPDDEFAALLYKRVAGVGKSLDDPAIQSMAAMITNGDMAGAVGVAMSDEENFLSITIRDMGGQMQLKNSAAPLNDYIATLIGVVRDEIDARELLTGNYIYRGAPGLPGVAGDRYGDILRSNDHYDTFAEQIGRGAALGNANRMTFSSRTDFVQEGQRIVTGDNTEALHPEPAGLVTSRGFMSNAVEAGTNRAAIEIAFQQFGCISADEWGDASLPDQFVGKDITRFPDNDNLIFQSTCKKCHSILGGLRGAFAQYDFQDDFVKHADFLQLTNDTTPNEFQFTATRDEDDINANGNNRENIPIAAKMNHNVVYQQAVHVSGNAFQNVATVGKNASYWGWGGFTSGNGPQDFGRMIASSDAFPRCMVKHVFESVCRKDKDLIGSSDVNRIADSFKTNGYNIKRIFEQVPSVVSCFGN